ncbi:unnamed protein product [Paramecium primaurelia]|uniref:Transmembrane protein n=1 Tax=Paramecium primaurelia TaxID=5886 RepID=A0A8S1MTV9_PARPR|nr:unnamed protein product [Paramecium primaurelia]
MIIKEFTSQPSKYIHFGLQILNDLLILKCGLLIFTNGQKPENSFEIFLLYLVRPYAYFIRSNLQVEYILFSFVTMQIFILYWFYLMNIQKNDKKTTSYIDQISKYESLSTLYFLMIKIWKTLFLFLTEFLGYLLIEGYFLILFDKIQDNLFCIISSVIIIFEILIIIILQELFWNQSLHYIPKQLNQINQPTISILYTKLLKIITLCLFASQISYKSVIVLGISILNSIYELYILLILKIKHDLMIISLDVLMQCLIICVSIQQLIINASNFGLQFLWIIVGILLYKLISLYYLNNSILQIQVVQLNDNNIDYKLLDGKQKLFKYQKLIQERGSEYRLANKILVIQHQQKCNKQYCFCRNDEMIMIKLEHLILKEQIDIFKTFIKQSQIQSSLFYLQFIQLLIYNNRLFEALNITQKLLNSFNRKSQYTKQVQLIKGQVSITHKMLFRLLQHQIFMSIRCSIQSKSSSATKLQVIKQAIRQFQQKFDSEKTIQNKFNDIMKYKIDFLDDLSNTPNLDDEFINYQAFKIIQEMDQFKELLMYNFQQMPTSNNKSLLLFFQIEILNDLINSQTINTMNTHLEDQEQIIFSNNVYQELVNQYYFASFILKDEDNIEFVSNNEKKQLKIGQRKYIAFEEMVPQSLISLHKYLIKDFFQTGKNKYYLNINQSFLQVSTGIISPIEMCMDISFDLKMNQLLVTTFLKQLNSDNQVHYIILDSQFKIREISQVLYENILDYPANTKMLLYDISVFIFIPELKEKDFIQDRTLGLYKLFFPLNINKQTSPNLKTYKKSLEFFQGLISVKVRFINKKNLYYIIEISDLKSEKPQLLESISIPQGEIDEKEIINIPLEINLWNEITSLNQMNQQQYTSLLDSQRPLLVNSLSDGLELKIENNHKLDNNSKINKKLQNSIASVQDQYSEKAQQQFDDVGSQVSSVAAVRRSLYFKQFKVINELIYSKIFPNNIKLFNITFFIYILVGIINMIILIEQVQNLQKYQDLMVLLSIKYDIYEPIESFLNTRYTIVGLNQAISTKMITQQEYNELVAFPNSNLVKGYDDLKSNIMDVIQRKEFQSFLKDYYFESYWYTSTNKGSQRNTTFRSGILAMLNYQYEYKLAFTIRPLVIDSAYSYYSYKNYLSIFSIFTQLSNDILDLLINSLSNQQIELIVINATFNCLLTIISICYFYYLVKQRRLKNKILSLLPQQDKDIMLYEIQRLKLLQSHINANYNYLCQYTLEIQQFDENLKKQEGEFYKLVNRKGKKTSGLKRKRQVTIYNFIQVGIFLFSFIIILLINLLTINSLDQYLFKQKNTGQIYSSLSNTGVNILIIYAQREILYRIVAFAFLTSQDIQGIQDQVDNSLIQIQNFSTQFLQVNQNDYLLDDNSMNLFTDISTQSLCNFLPEKYANVSQSLCPFVLQGILNKGLIPTLNLMYTSVYAEKQVNNFTSRPPTQVPLRELEGATFTSWVIKELVKDLAQNLNNYSSQLQMTFTIIYAFFIAFQLLFGLIIVIKISNYEMIQISHLRKVVYLLPQSILLFDDSFQRQIKIIMKQEDLT